MPIVESNPANSRDSRHIELINAIYNISIEFDEPDAVHDPLSK